jgi:PAS domain S-box-containing protein
VYLAINHVQTLKIQRERDAMDRVLSVASIIDNQLRAHIAGLRLLAESPLIDNPPRLNEFYKEALAFRTSYGGHIILADLSTQMILNTRVPFGKALPKLPVPRGHAAVPLVLATGKPAVGDMFYGPVARQPLVAVVAPVIRNNRIKFFLVNTFEAHQFQYILDELLLPAGSSVTVLDGKNEVIVHSRPAGLKDRTVDSASPHRLSARSAITHWSVVLEVSRSVYRTSIISAIITLAAAILAVTLVSILGGRLAGSWLASSIAELAATLPSHTERLEIEEIEAVRNLLYAASAAREEALEDLQIHQTALQEERSRLSAIITGSNVGTWEWNVQTGATVFNERWAEIIGYSLEELSPLSIKTWRKFAHPDDLKISNELLEKHFHGDLDYYEFDSRMKHKDGGWVWVIDRGKVTTWTEDGKPLLMQGTHTDISHRKRAEEIQVFLAQAGNGTEGEPFFNTLARYLARSLRMEFVCIDRLEGDGLTARTVAVWCDDHFEDNVTYALKDTPCGDVVGKTVCCFPSGVTRLFPHDEVLQDLLAESYVGATLWSHTGEPIGLIAVIGRNPLSNRSLAEETLKLVAVRAAGEMERLDAEAALQQSRDLLESVEEISKVGGWEWDVARQTMLWTDETFRIHGFVPGEVQPESPELIRRSLACYDPEDRPLVEAALRRCVEEGEPYNLELPFSTADGRRLWIQTMARPVFEGEHVVKVLGNIMDITVRKKMDRAMIEEKNRAQSYLDIAGVMFVVLDENGAVTLVNSKAAEILGYEQEYILKKNWFEHFLPMNIREQVESVYRGLLSGEMESLAYFENAVLTRTGEERIIAWHNTLLQDVGGKILGTLSSGMDITDRKRAETSLQASLAEKEVLLREVHHRVKNNLASIIGLLDLQKDKITDGAALASLKELGDRILSMALVHESLYRSDDMARIDFQGYINDLTAHLLSSYGACSFIRCLVEVTGVEMELDLAIPTGLIINELVTNAIKHAFPRGEPRTGSDGCKILVALQKVEDAYTLIVADNGVGLPANLDWRSCSSLGLVLVSMLSEHQLRGQLQLDQSEGTRFVLRFKDRTRQFLGR